jgi:hypothetical protein
MPRYIAFLLDTQIAEGTPLFEQTDANVDEESLLAAISKGERIDTPEIYRRHFAELPLTVGSALKISSRLVK